MNTQDNFPEVVSGRITTRAKKLMEKYGLTVRFCVEHCIDMYVSKQNQRLIEKDQLKEEIRSLKLDLIAKEMQLETVMKELGDEDNE